jgi:polysaccharide export outer membrane protein
MQPRFLSITRLARIFLACCLAFGFWAALGEDQKQPKRGAAQESPAASSPETGAGSSRFPATPDYIIGAEDLLEIHVWREQELSGPMTVRPDGKISMRLIGEVQAAGRTPEELGKVIREALAAKYLQDPIVTVTVRQVNSKKYFVQGEVNRPGPFPLLVPTTVFEAISISGGFREFAKKNKIVVMRKGKRIPFNYKEVEKGKKMEQNIYLENGDVIIVP